MRLKLSCRISTLDLGKKPSFCKETARSQGLRLSARFTIPCLGLVLTLFRTEASQIVHQRGRKAIPCPRHIPNPYRPNKGVPTPGSNSLRTKLGQLNEWNHTLLLIHDMYTCTLYMYQLATVCYCMLA